MTHQRLPQQSPPKKCAVMQPTYLPWMGYFALMDSVDVFVLDDLAQFVQKSWHRRNRIMDRQGRVILLGVPVNGHRAPLNTIRVAHQKWQKNHWSSIERAYRKTQGWESIRGALMGGYTFPVRGLTEMTGHFIVRLATVLGIKTRIVLASDLGPLREGMHERVADMCRAVGADVLANPASAQAWIDEENLEGVAVDWMRYEHPTYDQGTEVFTSHLSVLDCIAHCADQALSTIRKGFYATGCDQAPKAHTKP